MFLPPLPTSAFPLSVFRQKHIFISNSAEYFRWSSAETGTNRQPGKQQGQGIYRQPRSGHRQSEILQAIEQHQKLRLHPLLRRMLTRLKELLLLVALFAKLSHSSLRGLPQFKESLVRHGWEFALFCFSCIKILTLHALARLF